MEHIMDYTTIFIKDKYGRRSFGRILDKNELPNYFLTDKQSSQLDDLNIDECYFFPIELKEFIPSRTKQHYGLKYLFSSTTHQVLRIPNAPESFVDISHFQMVSEVRRVRYKITDKLELTITKECDTLALPQIVDITVPTAQLGLMVLGQTREIISVYNSHYVDKKI